MLATSTVIRHCWLMWLDAAMLVLNLLFGLVGGYSGDESLLITSVLFGAFFVVILPGSTRRAFARLSDDIKRQQVDAFIRGE